jgi:hypothetical protein
MEQIQQGRGSNFMGGLDEMQQGRMGNPHCAMELGRRSSVQGGTGSFNGSMEQLQQQGKLQAGSFSGSMEQLQQQQARMGSVHGSFKGTMEELQQQVLLPQQQELQLVV